MSASTQTADELTDDQKLDERAATQILSVLEYVGRVRDVPGQWLVVSESGKEYLVDGRLPACECPDARYRDRKCKHMRRVEFATGRRAIPAHIDRDDVDDAIGDHCSGTVRFETTDERSDT